MRVLSAVTLFGALAMSTAVADEPKSPSDPKNYTEKATIRHFNRGRLLSPVKDQPVMRGEIDGKKVIYTMPTAGNVKTPPKSEIAIGDETWVVETATEGSVYWINYVKPKPKDK